MRGKERNLEAHQIHQEDQNGSPQRLEKYKIIFICGNRTKMESLGAERGGDNKTSIFASSASMKI